MKNRIRDMKDKYKCQIHEDQMCGGCKDCDKFQLISNFSDQILKTLNEEIEKEKNPAVMLGLSKLQEKIYKALNDYHLDLLGLDDGERHRGYEGDLIIEGSIKEILDIFTEALLDKLEEKEK